MSDDGVPWDEMRWTGSHTDPIDAVLAGSDDREDLLDVAAMVHDLQATYLRATPLRRSPELVAFTEGDLGAARHLAGRTSEAGPLSAADRKPAKRKRKSMLTGLSTFVGTVTGKVVLGTAVAAASAGTLHATNVVDVPALPDSQRPTEQPADDAGNPGGRPEDPGRPDQAGEGTSTAEANREAAATYTDAVQDWTDCVSDAASNQGDAQTRTTGGFDPAEACGDRPQPADYGLNELPSQAADAAGEATGDPPAGPGEAPAAPAEETPAETPGENAPEPPYSRSAGPGHRGAVSGRGRRS